ncbi:MarR family winged helix-turn-helix transcriptional regulator [Nocardia fluminea]|uniref:MarR family winged helix-turn-helix transcriptional regulator n=1 Tax=Nocardia fluminea TaxID=134984 RepID=UPI003D14C685
MRGDVAHPPARTQRRRLPFGGGEIVEQVGGPGGTRLTDLAAQAQVTKQTASTLADHLVRAGYLERVADPTDGRARLLRLTPTGRTAADLGKRAATDLRRTLTALREITDPYA